MKFLNCCIKIKTRQPPLLAVCGIPALLRGAGPRRACEPCGHAGAGQALPRRRAAGHDAAAVLGSLGRRRVTGEDEDIGDL